jgi:hypothetical protein
MTTSRTIIIGVVIILLAFGAGLCWRGVQGTPYYALYQIGSGLKNRDINTFITYVDVEAILNQQGSSIKNLLSSLTASSSLGNIAGPLGEIKIQLPTEVYKSLSHLVIQQIRDYLENLKNPTLPSSFLLLTISRVQVNQDRALVTMKHDKDQLRMTMRKQKGIWRVVELEPEDTHRLIKTYLLPPAK